MKKILMLTSVMLCMAAEARIPDFPDYRDDQGFLYKRFRSDVTNKEIEGHDGEVQFWGIDDRDPKFEEKFKNLKVLKVPAVMKAQTDDGKVITRRVTAIDGHAFSGMPNLEEIIVPEGITYINPFAISGTKAKRISLPSTIKPLYYDSFNFFQSKWEKITISPKHPTYCDINGIIYTKDKKKLCVCPVQYQGKVVMPPTLTEVEKEAFEDAANIKSLILPKGVVTIGKSAFYKSSIESIILPETLKTIGENALNYCKNLKTIRCRAATPPKVGEDNLWGLHLDTLTVYIPKGSIGEYQKADWWKHIKNFVEE